MKKVKGSALTRGKVPPERRGERVGGMDFG